MNNLPENIIFTQEHVWLLPVGNDEFTLGISDYAQDQLGDLVFVELPEIQTSVQAGNACAVVESVKSASDVICPLDGKIIEVNEALDESPESINESPYQEGWIMRIIRHTNSEIEGKMNAEQYTEFLQNNTN
ncbi:MAG: glycine cleavage system protein GcvH [Pseudomonadota bacterium]